MKKLVSLKNLGLCAALFLFTATAMSANIVIVAGAGFNDNTPVAPIGGNNGTTIGQQRLNAFEFAAEIWGDVLESNVNIRVQAAFAPQSCSASSAVLGSAGTIEVDRDFPNAPIGNTWYSIALANSIAGFDLSPGTNDINATFNASIDNNNNCLSGTNWYYGLDGNAPGNTIDFLAVLAHELGHGLGFQGFTQSNGSLFAGRQDVFGRNSFDNSLGLFFDQMTQSQRFNALRSPGNLVWGGGNTAAVADALLNSGKDANGLTRLYAPTSFAPGSSYSHFDTVASPNLLMEPFINGNLDPARSLDLTTALFSDIGWQLTDQDADIIPDRSDNCTLVANTNQIDADNDDYGNFCDPDFDNDGIVNFVDLGLFKSVVFTDNPVADLNSDGSVNFVDLGIFRTLVFMPPGPSGLAP